MTWKELKEKIGKMPIQQQETEVLCLGEEKPLTPMNLDYCDENMYYSHEWDSCCPESDLDIEQKKDKNTILYAKKGTPYLWIE